MLRNRHLNCCIIHGCKYHDKNCPMVNGIIKRDNICEFCIDDLFKNKPNPGIEEQDRLMLNQRNKMNSLYLIKNRIQKLNKIKSKI